MNSAFCSNQYKKTRIARHIKINEIFDNGLTYFLAVPRKDVKLPLSLQRAMAAEAEADRDARAKVNPIASLCDSIFDEPHSPLAARRPSV